MRVDFSRAPQDRSRYEAHFGCPVRFKAPTSALIFRTSDLDRPFVTHNADLLGILMPLLDAELADRNDNDVRSQVRAVLQRLLRGRRPDLQDVARQLASSVRTLQRRLGDIGMSFQTLLEEVRLDMARHYLAKSSLELAEIAYLLGYEDGNSFVRAFNRWAGVPPGRWRGAQRVPASSRRPTASRRRRASASRRRIAVTS
jgi:AraC-like DNA-binding protein